MDGDTVAISRPSLRPRRRGLLILLVAAAIAVGAVSIAGMRVEGLHWRALLVQQKMRGVHPELTWSELLSMTAGRDIFGIGQPIAEGRSLDAAISNPYDDPQDIPFGKSLFHEHCAVCHGADATGGHGPSLVRPNLDHGDSDFALYLVVRDGVPGTAMVPTGLTALERWRVIGYLRTLQHRSAADDTNTAAPIDVSAGDLDAAGAKQNEWLTYSGSLLGWRYSRATGLTPRNVSQLRLLWIKQFATESTVQESTPLAIGTSLFVTQSPSNAIALDATTGRTLWRYDRPLPPNLPVCCGAVNRGLAVLGGTLYMATLDAHLVALDARTGRVKWDHKVADYERGFTMTLAPLVFGNVVVVGGSGGEYGTNGYIAAYNADSGALLWRFETIPGVGEAGHESWSKDSWHTGGGPAWVTGSYDPALDLIYWGTGNPSPDYQGAGRLGDNLYTDSVVALHAHTGKLAWHFQFTPHDEHDWDSAQTPILADLEIGGIRRQVICWANRNGFYYVLDRVTGEFLSGTAFAKQNWATGLDSKGRPELAPAMRASAAGALVFPGVRGATNWQPSAFDPVASRLFVPVNEQGSVFTKTPPNDTKAGEQGFFVGSGAASSDTASPRVRALEAATGTQLWEYVAPSNPAASGFSGLTVTAGHLVFGTANGYAFALDADTGRECWRQQLGGNTRGPPITVEIDGRQAVVVWGGRSLFVFGL